MWEICVSLPCQLTFIMNRTVTYCATTWSFLFPHTTLWDPITIQLPQEIYSSSQRRNSATGQTGFHSCSRRLNGYHIWNTGVEFLGPCPKRVGCFGSSTRFQMRKVVGKWYRFCKKIMSLVYAKKNDDIGMCFVCVSRVSTCECSVCSSVVSRYLMY
jgi:hypothetical protein